MKKIMITAVLAVALVLAFGGTALAKGYAPGNRSSSFLDKGENYIAWDKAQSKMAGAGVSATDSASVHGNYSTTTVKCQVCHSAHKAAATGDTLLQSTAAQSCVPCHLGASALTSTKVSEGNRHGSATGCTSGYCHSVSPHGAGDVSKYETLKTAMLTDHADSLLDAAIASGVSGSAVEGNVFATGSDASDPASVIATIAVYNPGVTAAILNDVSDAATVAYGRSIGTGYVCANGGCHINGAFNSTTADSTFGAWDGNVDVTSEQTPPSYETTIPVGVYGPTDTVTNANGTFNVWEVLHMREEPIKGHTLAAVADLAVRDVAFANVGACSTCHDSIDYRISSTTKQFPHGNDVIATDGTDTGANSSAWFMLKGNVGDTAIATDGRDVADADYTSGMDGACLKCHRDTGDAAGVGITY
ncbi:MAG: hypothetical protein JXE06_04025 [Coriobacteriia bacterium]|nr:hypothetical protein [Coriobacteriia bacterium]MBN2823361.1 hypothetical protein [Coriobacteriia bacterium]